MIMQERLKYILLKPRRKKTPNEAEKIFEEMTGNFEHYWKKTNYRSSKFREPRRRIKIEIKHIKNNDSETTENQTHTQKILNSATAKREHHLEVLKKKIKYHNSLFIRTYTSRNQ